MVQRRASKAKTTPLVVLNKRKATYLRKSRDESQGKEDILSKHRMQLVELCERNGWEYVIYEEVGSSDSLEARPKMMQLLDDVKDGLYDGVVVMDYDRLSRGDELDAAIIKRTFRDAGVVIHTPQKTYNLADEDEEFLMTIVAGAARIEYQRTKRRLQRGKVNGAKQGKWVQGNPPYPYFYDSEKKVVAVDEDKRQHYETMLDDALAGMSPGDVAIKLNRLGVKTNRNGAWVAETVQRLLLNPFHMGRVIYGKTKSDKEGNRLSLSRDEWAIGEGSHERLKTPEQHARLLELISSRRRIGNRAQAGQTPLSGLVKCALCGKTHQSTFHRGRMVLFACTRRSPVGEICPNGGVPASVVYEAIENAAKDEVRRLVEESENVATRAVGIPALLEAERRELEAEEAKLSKLVDLAVSGLITKEMLAEKKAPIESSILRLKTSIANLEETTATGEMPVEERRQKLSTILSGDFWTRDDWTDKERHGLLTTLIDHIDLRATISRRKDTPSDVDIRVEFR